jgi:geranylgeranyl reductase family protein
MKRPDFDVIVAGAGAGGASAAYFLTRAGLTVMVIEKEIVPRYKACGGAIPRQTLEQFPFDFNNIPQTAPVGVRLTFPGQSPVSFSLPDRPVVMIMRDDFDAFLLTRSGAELLPATAVANVAVGDDCVRVEAGGRRLTARYLVGADGAASGVARCLGLRRGRTAAGALEAEVPLEGQRVLHQEYASQAIFAMGVVPWGYAWVFPKREYLSVGILHSRRGRIDLRAALRQVMEVLGISLEGVRLHGHPLPVYQAPPWPFWRGQPQETLSTHRCVLVGDAAGLVDPLLGEGIRYAITSGRLAARAIAQDDLSGYEDAIWKEIGRDLATAGLAASTYYRIPRLSYQLGLQNPATVRHILGVLAGRASYVGIGRRVLAATLLWLLGVQKSADNGRD